jgi:hypothetical protein
LSLKHRKTFRVSQRGVDMEARYAKDLIAQRPQRLPAADMQNSNLFIG